MEAIEQAQEDANIASYVRWWVPPHALSLLAQGTTFTRETPPNCHLHSQICLKSVRKYSNMVSSRAYIPFRLSLFYLVTKTNPNLENNTSPYIPFPKSQSPMATLKCNLSLSLPLASCGGNDLVHLCYRGEHGHQNHPTIATFSFIRVTWTILCSHFYFSHFFSSKLFFNFTFYNLI